MDPLALRVASRYARRSPAKSPRGPSRFRPRAPGDDSYSDVTDPGVSEQSPDITEVSKESGLEAV